MLMGADHFEITTFNSGSLVANSITVTVTVTTSYYYNYYYNYYLPLLLHYYNVTTTTYLLLLLYIVCSGQCFKSYGLLLVNDHYHYVFYTVSIILSMITLT